MIIITKNNDIVFPPGIGLVTIGSSLEATTHNCRAFTQYYSSSRMLVASKQYLFCPQPKHSTKSLLLLFGLVSTIWPASCSTVEQVHQPEKQNNERF